MEIKLKRIGEISEFNKFTIGGRDYWDDIMETLCKEGLRDETFEVCLSLRCLNTSNAIQVIKEDRDEF